MAFIAVLRPCSVAKVCWNSPTIACMHAALPCPWTVSEAHHSRRQQHDGPLEGQVKSASDGFPHWVSVTKVLRVYVQHGIVNNECHPSSTYPTLAVPSPRHSKNNLLVSVIGVVVERVPIGLTSIHERSISEASVSTPQSATTHPCDVGCYDEQCSVQRTPCGG